MSSVSSLLQVESGGALAAQVLKDSTGAQLIAKTLDKLNGSNLAAGLNQDYQFQKDVLQASGIGGKLDSLV